MWKKVGVGERFGLKFSFLFCFAVDIHTDAESILLFFKKKFMYCGCYFEVFPNYLKIRVAENKSPRRLPT